VHVEVSGPAGAPVLLLLHAFPLHGGMWAAQVDALSGAWRVVVPDFRGFGGFGGSDPGDGQYAIDFMVDDVLAVLDTKELGLRAGPIAACGCSMGGYVLLRAVERAPERFRALVLADTKSGADDDAGKLKRFAAVRTIREKGVAAYAIAFAEAALGPTTRAKRTEVARRVVSMVRSSPMTGLVGAQLAMAARTDTTGALSGIAVPTLVVVGGEDPIIPPDVCREMAARIPGARLEVIPEAGHLPPMEASDAFNAALEGFLAGLPGAE